MKIAGRGQLHERRGTGGRPGHLVRYLEKPGISEPVSVLACAMANDWDWFARHSAFFDRHIGQGESLEVCAANLKIKIEMAEHLIKRIEVLECEAVGRHFIPSWCSTFKTLPTLKQRARRQQAVAISKSMLTATRKNATLVRNVVSGYSSAVNRRMQIVLTRQEDAHFGRDVIDFVKLLKIPGLDIRFVGFRVGKQRSNADHWLQALHLPVDTPVHWVSAPNKNSSASTLHFRIEVVHRDQEGGARTSGTFHLVMILAKVVEIWRLPFKAKQQSVREEDRQSKAIQLLLFEGPSPESLR